MTVTAVNKSIQTINDSIDAIVKSFGKFIGKGYSLESN